MREDLADQIRRSDELRRKLNAAIRDAQQSIASLIAIKGSRATSPEAKRLATSLRLRLEAIALAYAQHDVDSDQDKVDLAPCLERLANDMRFVYCRSRPGLGLRVAVERTMLEVHRARCLLLIASELVGNAFEHAFTGREFGTVELGIRSLTPSGALLWVADNGVGLSAPVTCYARFSGLDIVHALSQTIGAQVVHERGPGTRIEVRFAIDT